MFWIRITNLGRCYCTALKRAKILAICPVLSWAESPLSATTLSLIWERNFLGNVYAYESNLFFDTFYCIVYYYTPLSSLLLLMLFFVNATIFIFSDTTWTWSTCSLWIKATVQLWIFMPMRLCLRIQTILLNGNSLKGDTLWSESTNAIERTFQTLILNSWYIRLWISFFRI